MENLRRLMQVPLLCKIDGRFGADACGFFGLDLNQGSELLYCGSGFAAAHSAPSCFALPVPRRAFEYSTVILTTEAAFILCSYREVCCVLFQQPIDF